MTNIVRQGSLKQVVTSIWVLILIFSACNRRDEKQAGGINETTGDSTCYLFVQGRDSIKLSVLRVNGRVKGGLQFKFYEKDKSYGTIDGEMKGDTLLADYSFTSEGMLSHREVAFLERDGSFILGSGEIENSGTTDVFKDHAAIEFSDGVILRNTDCNTIF